MTGEMMEEKIGACSCMTVQYDPIHNNNGTCSERWRCKDCKTVFSKPHAPLSNQVDEGYEFCTWCGSPDHLRAGCQNTKNSYWRLKSTPLVNDGNASLRSEGLAEPLWEPIETAPIGKRLRIIHRLNANGHVSNWSEYSIEFTSEEHRDSQHSSLSEVLWKLCDLPKPENGTSADRREATKE